MVSNRNLLFQRSILRFHVKFQGCKKKNSFKSRDSEKNPATQGCLKPMLKILLGGLTHHVEARCFVHAFFQPRGKQKLRHFFLYEVISPDTAEVVHNIPLSSDSESEAVPPRAPPRKKKPAPPEATIMLLPSFFQGLQDEGNARGAFSTGQPIPFLFEEWQAALQQFFPGTLTRILNKWAGRRREAEKVKIPKRHVPIWQAFERLPHAEKRLGWKRS